MQHRYYHRELALQSLEGGKYDNFLWNKLHKMHLKELPAAQTPEPRVLTVGFWYQSREQ